MQLFRPTDVRIILVLSLLILAGSILTLLKRQHVISRLDLGIFAQESPYKYSYNQDDLARMTPVESTSAIEISPEAAERNADLARVNINRAGIYDLQALPGIGPAIAERIIAYRDSAGNFQNIEDLKKIKGIGPVKFEKLKNKVTVK